MNALPIAVWRVRLEAMIMRRRRGALHECMSEMHEQIRRWGPHAALRWAAKRGVPVEFAVAVHAIGNGGLK